MCYSEYNENKRTPKNNKPKGVENMKLYIDTESNSIITEAELKTEFEALKAEDPETYNYTFSEYLNNCTSKNGFLEEA